MDDERFCPYFKQNLKFLVLQRHVPAMLLIMIRIIQFFSRILIFMVCNDKSFAFPVRGGLDTTSFRFRDRTSWFREPFDVAKECLFLYNKQRDLCGINNEFKNNGSCIRSENIIIRYAYSNSNRNQSPYSQQQQHQQQRMRNKNRLDSTTTNYEQRRQESLNVGNNPLLSLNLNLDALARAAIVGNDDDDIVCYPQGQHGKKNKKTMRTQNIAAAERAQELYQRIFSLYQDGYYTCCPDIVSFNSVLKAWQYNPIQALEFWEQEQYDRIEYNHGNGRTKKGQKKFYPNLRSYNTFLLSLANSGLYIEAESLLRQMQQSDSAVIPDLVTYNTVLLACAVNGSIDATKCSVELLYEMINQYYNNDNNDDVDISSLTPKNDDKATTTTTTMLNEMLLSNYTSSVQPDSISYNTVLSTLSNQRNVNDALIADTIFARMKKNKIRPDVYTYTILIQTWARCQNGPMGVQRAVELLSEMNQNNIADSTNNDSDDDDDDNADGMLFEPNCRTYTAVIEAYCQNKQPNAGHEILNKLLQRCHFDNNNNQDEEDDYYKSTTAIKKKIQPDVVMFSTLLDGWSHVAHEQPEQSVTAAYQLMQQMDHTKIVPNSRTYTCLLKVLSSSRKWDSGIHAEQIVKEQMKLKHNIQPSIIHYNLVLDCYSKSTRATKAIDAYRFWKETIVQQPHHHQQQKPVVVARNDAGTTNTNIDRYVNDIRSDIITYNTLLGCVANAPCGSYVLKQQNTQIGLLIWNVILQRSTGTTSNKNGTIRPTSVTYQYILKIIRRFLYDTNQRNIPLLLDKVLRMCWEQGCFNNNVLHQVFQFVDGQSILEKHVYLWQTKKQKENNVYISSISSNVSLNSEHSRKTAKSIKIQSIQDLPPCWSRNAINVRTHAQHYQ